LRPGHEKLVLFSAIAGVPSELVEPSDYERVGLGWLDDTARDAFYRQILEHPRMQEVVDEQQPIGQRNLVPSCESERGKAYPPRRIVEVARRFGSNGTVHSICQEDFGPAIGLIAGTIGAQLGAPCLLRPLVRRADGLTECELIWELPPPGSASPATPTSCGQPGFEFLSTPTSGARSTERGGARCRVQQLAVDDGTVQPTDGLAAGWYYDDFSDVIREECLGGAGERVAFTPEARPPAGVAVRLVCPSAPGAGCED
jgi:hypothetical protein